MSDSPIEEAMASALYDRARGRHWYVRREVSIGPYRVDFLVDDRNGATLVVECDGHDYHERTKEQAAHDRQRDRYLLAVHGLTTARFTGSEIYRDVEACGDEVVNIMRDIGSRQFDEYARGIDIGFGHGVKHAVEAMSFDLDAIEQKPPVRRVYDEDDPRHPRWDD